MGNKYKTKSSLKTMLLAPILGASLIFSGCEIQEKLENNNESSFTSSASKNVREIPLRKNVKSIGEQKLSEEERIYFPLAEGNSWTYIRIVNKDIFSYAKKILAKKIFEKNSDLHADLQVTRYTISSNGKMLIPKLSEESYTILDIPASKELWMVKVEGPYPRDGRYAYSIDGPKSITKSMGWEYSGIGVSELISEKIPDTDSGEVIAEQRWLGILQPDINYIEPVKHGGGYQIQTERYNDQIKVPAGTFNDCLKSTTMVKRIPLEEVIRKGVKSEQASRLRTFYHTFSHEFTTESYFAKGVGLVKEVQYNDKGEETYRIELKSYNVK